MFAAQMLACLISQPMARPFDWCITCVTLTLTLMSSILRVVYGASTTDDEREDRGVLLTIAAVFDLMVSVVTIRPMLVDAIELLKHAVAKCSSQKQSTPVNIDADQDVELLLLEDDTQNHEVDIDGTDECSANALQFAKTVELDMSEVVEEQLLEMLEENGVEPQCTENDHVAVPSQLFLQPLHYCLSL
ncbi:membrane-associated protein, putative [Bodo saltans]|uniref:Membrane-associated protein, putative n=1 Tax=Bodo saltans TaxID=75058 RepID=A0A0S4J1Z3_BODSA|nr:membrane-associated protein, putative [Bodo saltans]|eukprot:CUG83632.1 membrane-associated protein, putative [Bodo saltans]